MPPTGLESVWCMIYSPVLGFGPVFVFSKSRARQKCPTLDAGHPRLWPTFSHTKEENMTQPVMLRVWDSIMFVQWFYSAIQDQGCAKLN